MLGIKSSCGMDFDSFKVLLGFFTRFMIRINEVKNSNKTFLMGSDEISVIMGNVGRNLEFC